MLLIFQSSGRELDCKERMKSRHRDGTTCSAVSFNILLGIPSGQVALCSFKECSKGRISSTVSSISVRQFSSVIVLGLFGLGEIQKQKTYETNQQSS